jgi:hypothetical protein
MGWIAWEPTADDPMCHVVPDFGREHQLNVGCWCHPEPDEEEELLLIHNAEM